MTLRVHTARISSRDPDRLDVTRKYANGDGLTFAPSWLILAPVIAMRKRHKAGVPGSFAERAIESNAAWANYQQLFLEEMRAGIRRDRGPLTRLLAQERVVLVCTCVDPGECHRAILRGFVLPKFGAVDAGEVS